MRIVIVAGGRDLLEVVPYEWATQALIDALAELGLTSATDLIIRQGEAKGGDAIGKAVAIHNGIPCESFKPDWNDVSHPDAVVRHNRHNTPYNALAGFWRNAEMENGADTVIAFWDGVSSGTRDMLHRMRSAGKIVKIIGYNGYIPE